MDYITTVQILVVQLEDHLKENEFRLGVLLLDHINRVNHCQFKASYLRSHKHDSQLRDRMYRMTQHSKSLSGFDNNALLLNAFFS